MHSLTATFHSLHEYWMPVPGYRWDFPRESCWGRSFGAKGRHVVGLLQRQPKALGCRDPDFGWKTPFLLHEKARLVRSGCGRKKIRIPNPAGSIPLTRTRGCPVLRQNEDEYDWAPDSENQSWPASFLTLHREETRRTEDDWLQQGKTED